MQFNYVALEDQGASVHEKTKTKQKQTLKAVLPDERFIKISCDS